MTTFIQAYVGIGLLMAVVVGIGLRFKFDAVKRMQKIPQFHAAFAAAGVLLLCVALWPFFLYRAIKEATK